MYIPAIGLVEPVYLAPIVDRQYVIGSGVYRLDQTTRFDGSPGTLILAGHSPGVFEHMQELEQGDHIVIFTVRRVWVFVVTRAWLTMPSDDAMLHHAPPGWRLIVITCEDEARRIVEALPVDRSD